MVRVEPIKYNIETVEREITRKNNFGSIRFILAILVIISHSYPIKFGNNDNELLYLLTKTMTLGELAVDGFFIVSGYLIYDSYLRSRTLAGYIFKRCLRIFPGFTAAYLICFLLVAPLVGGHIVDASPFTSLLYLVNLVGPYVPGAFEILPIPNLNGSAWTVFYEFRCYLYVLFVAPLIAKNRSIFAVFFCAFTAVYFFRGSIPNIPHVTQIIGFTADAIRLTWIFMVGVAFNVWKDKIEYKKSMVVVCACMLCLTVFFKSLAEPSMVLLGGYIMFWYVFEGQVNALSRIMDRVDPSYGIYLYGWPIQSVLLYILPALSPISITLLAIPIATCLGLLSWTFIEGPAIRLKLKFGMPPLGGPGAKLRHRRSRDDGRASE